MERISAKCGPYKMESAAADNVAVIFEDDEVAHVLADFGEGARQ